MGRPRPRHHGHPRMGLHPDTHRHPRGHARILQRPARRSRHPRNAKNPGQVADRLARPPESHRRIHKLTSASPSSTTRKEGRKETMAATETSAMRPLLLADDLQFWYETLRWLGLAACGGADFGEVVTTAARITANDYDSWYEQCAATTQRVEAEARPSQLQGDDRRR